MIKKIIAIIMLIISFVSLLTTIIIGIKYQDTLNTNIIVACLYVFGALTSLSASCLIIIFAKEEGGKQD